MGKISIVSMNNEDIFNFPCDYPIKIFGLSQPSLKKLFVKLLRVILANFTQIKLPLKTALKENTLQ